MGLDAGTGYTPSRVCGRQLIQHVISQGHSLSSFFYIPREFWFFKYIT